MLELRYINIEKQRIATKHLDLKFDLKKITSSKFLSFEEVNNGKIIYFSSHEREKFIKFYLDDELKIYCHCIIDDVIDENSFDFTCVNFIDSNHLFSSERIFTFLK